MDAVTTLKRIEAEGRAATADEQETLSRYTGWGAIPDAFDENKGDWAKEYAELKAALTPEEYEAARGSTLNAHYTSPVVIRAIYDALANLGFEGGRILEPSCGVGNFFGLLPESMANSQLYGVELDSITGLIAQQLYPEAEITVAGFETTNRPGFFDLAVGNVPFGNYQVFDPRVQPPRLFHPQLLRRQDARTGASWRHCRVCNLALHDGRERRECQAVSR